MLDFGEPAACQKVAVRRQPGGAQSSVQREEAIHGTQPHQGMQLPESASRFLKVAHQPTGVRSEKSDYLEDNGWGVAAVQYVEEKMTDNKIERTIGQGVGHCVDLMKLHSRTFIR